MAIPAPEMTKINPDKVWSVANGRIKTVDLTKDTLSDFENFKKQAEALYGTAEDPYQSDSGSTGAVYAYRLTDTDPASWLPQWAEASSQTTEAKPGEDDADPLNLRDRMQNLFSVNNETGAEQTKWSSRVLQHWLEAKLPAPTTGAGPQPVDTTV